MRIAVACCAIGLLLAACGRSDSPRPGGEVTEYTAILATLEATRRDVHDLRDDIAALRKDVSALQSRAAGAPAAAPAEPPGPHVSELALDPGSPVVGSADAKVAMVEFTDYQCPFCARFEEHSLPRIKASYVDTGKLKIIVRDLPLDFHENAVGAALAAKCAAAQGAYEPVRQGLFANQQSLGPPLYKQLAEKSKLDMGKFDACLGDAANAEAIRADSTYAASIGVTGTPSFFIGRVEGNKLVDVQTLVGAQPFETFAAIIDKLP
jgi:protein-disulfide isomerase